MAAGKQEINDYVKKFYNETCVKKDFICKVNMSDLTPKIKEIVSQLSQETMDRYYGSGIIIPDSVEGKKVLDIGCGSGSLVFILSKLVGENGSVQGVDLTPNLIQLCKDNEEYHCNKWGYKSKNTQFQEGNAESLDFPDNTFDVVVSNGVFCLVPNKQNAFSEGYRVLKPGGEFFLNDVYGETAPPEEMMADLKAWDLGLTGSQLWKDFLDCAKKAGFTTPYLTCVGDVGMSKEYEEKLSGRRYLCAGIRLFKIGSESRGPATVTYKGTIEGQEAEFKWDVNLTFKKGQPVNVDGELATILAFGCYKDCFDIADTGESPTTQRGQNPFTEKDKMVAEGKTLPYIYTVE